MGDKQYINGSYLSRPISGLYGFGILLCANLLSGAALGLIASQRVAAINASLVVYIITFNQWLNFGTTVAKFGLDAYVFTTITQNPLLVFDLKFFVQRYMVPAAIAFSMLAYTVFGLQSAIACSLIVVLESISVILAAEQNARGLYLRSALSALLRYPLFLTLLGISMLLLSPTKSITLILLVSSSVLRTLITYRLTIRPPEATIIVRYRVTLRAASQYPLNYLLFRFDQILLSSFAGGAVGLKPLGEFVSEYAFMSRWPELVSGIASSAAIVLFPRYHLRPGPQRLATRAASAPKILLYGGAYVGILTLGTILYSMVWKTGSIHFYLLIPFIAQVVLIVPANLVTYSMLREDCLHGLVFRLASIVGVGSILISVALWQHLQLLFAYVVPLQLAALIISAYFLPWGIKCPIYEVCEPLECQLT